MPALVEKQLGVLALYLSKDVIDCLYEESQRKKIVSTT